MGTRGSQPTMVPGLCTPYLYCWREAKANGGPGFPRSEGYYSISNRGSTSPSRRKRATSISVERLWPNSVRLPASASDR